MPESSRPHTHTSSKTANPTWKRKPQHKSHYHILLVRHQHNRAKTSPNKKGKKKNFTKLLQKQINTQNTKTNKASLQSLREKKPPKTQNLRGEQEEKIYEQSKFSLKKKKSLFVLFLFETNKQTTNALASKKESKKERKIDTKNGCAIDVPTHRNCTCFMGGVSSSVVRGRRWEGTNNSKNQQHQQLSSGSLCDNAWLLAGAFAL